MKKKKKLFIHFRISRLLLVCLFVGCSQDRNPVGNNGTQPTFQLSDFSSAEECKDCHPNHYDEWKGSMHAYSFLDPINTAWMNGLRESIGETELGQTCVQCHSPIGMLTGETPVGFSKEMVDPLVKEGITCDVCHLMEEASGTTIGEAIYHFDVKGGKEYGSIMEPVPNGFHLSEGKLFYSQSKVCLPCHDLINNNGLPVEITYTEWQESPYIAMGLQCQGCHMETYAGRAAEGGPQRNNLHRHDFIGVDIALLDNFPNKMEQKLKIQHLLENSVSLTVDTPNTISPNDALDIMVTVTNDQTGHDIPSSVTFVRQMWIELTVTSGADTLFKSGYFDANGDLMDENSALNPNADPDLVIFQSALYKDGQPANVVTAESIEIGSIGPFESKSGSYSIALPSTLANSVVVKVRLRFRAFPPYAIRDGAAEFIDRIPIFEMEESQKTIVVSQ